jgi:hypothetical protein
MNSSSEEDVVVAYKSMYLQGTRQERRRYWVHPYNVRNIKHSSAVVSRELSQHEEKFRDFYRMSPESGFSTVAESGHKLQTRCSANWEITHYNKVSEYNFDECHFVTGLSIKTQKEYFMYETFI